VNGKTPQDLVNNSGDPIRNERERMKGVAGVREKNLPLVQACELMGVSKR
jgi:hypothetical protein